MRKLLFGLGLVALVSCGTKHGGTGTGDGGTTDGGPQKPDACVGLQCQVADCSQSTTGDTTLSGRVFAPNGTLPLYDVQVYVPNADPGPFPTTLTCSNCADSLPGEPIVSTTTDDHGNFTLAGVPAGASIPLVITIGKWRRQLVLPTVPSCMTTPGAATDTTLPKSRTDMTPNTKSVDLPNIAISTGEADALECLIRKLGIADTEIKTVGQDGRVHLFADNHASGGTGIAKFQSGYAGGSGAFADSETLWGTTAGSDLLDNYDIVILSCEGAQHDESKPQAAMNNLKAYADAGGRVFLSHWHNIWIEGNTQDNGSEKPAVWPSIAVFNDSNTTLGNNTNDLIDTVHNSKGSDFETWALDPQVLASTTADQIAIENQTGKNTCTSIDNTKGEDWVNEPDGTTPQIFQFTTPNEADAGTRCGKVVFSDMHVSGDSKSRNGDSYPQDCSTADLTPQEKALAFMFFDISSCVSSIE